MTEKGIIQRSYKMMSIVKPRLLRRGEFTRIIVRETIFEIKEI
jgi:hypothetical protein